jgi:hypothetical protein
VGCRPGRGYSSRWAADIIAAWHNSGLVAAAAACVATVLSGATLVVPSRRDERRWRREAIIDTLVIFIVASFVRGARGALDDRAGPEGPGGVFRVPPRRVTRRAARELKPGDVGPWKGQRCRRVRRGAGFDGNACPRFRWSGPMTTAPAGGNRTAVPAVFPTRSPSVGEGLASPGRGTRPGTRRSETPISTHG